ncbi:MAG: hypothetical protein QHJ73_10185, partial [Armatimonadota bacterium]|nr:hypothetical protein [Armatimonadota bacterium]
MFQWGRGLGKVRKGLLLLCFVVGFTAWPARLGHLPPPPPPKPRPTDIVVPLPPPPPQRRWHSRHIVKTWLTNYRGRVFRTIQLPRCQHVEMVLTYTPAPGATVAEVKKRLNAIAVSSGSYHHPQSMALADFFQKEGRVLMQRRTQRGILTSRDDGEVVDILDEIVRGERVSAVALGSRLVPFKLDGFSKAFANQQTDRMAIGLTKG